MSVPFFLPFFMDFSLSLVIPSAFNFDYPLISLVSVFCELLASSKLLQQALESDIQYPLELRE